ncbi:MAG: histidine kinase, partial [Sphingobacteriaceae bacterium]|nr:histidine kinase [Cytophagaceae bacterium]
DLRKKVFYHHAHNPNRVSVFNDHAIAPLTFDRNNILIFSDYLAKKLVFYSPGTNTATYSEEVILKNTNHQPSYIATIVADGRNNLWVCAWNNEVYHRDAATQVWYPIRHDDANPASISYPFFWDVLPARDGTVYVGGVYGLSVYRPTASFFKVLRAPVARPDQPITHIRAMVEDSVGYLWLVPNGPWEGLLRYDLKTGTARAFPLAGHGSPSVSLRSVFHLEFVGRELYLGTGQGITGFDPRSGQFRSVPGLPMGKENYVTWCHRDRRQTLWFSLGGQWLGQYDERTGRLTRHNPDSLFSNPAEKTPITAGAEDPSGTMWFATASGRLYRYDAGQARFTLHVPDPRQSPKVLQQSINALYADPSGKLWLATEGGGLLKFDPATNRFKAWMESDGLLQDVCRSILPDAQGRLWVGTYEGFTRFDPKSERIENPRMDYGQRENNFFYTSECALRDGRLVFADGNRLILIDPSRVNGRQRPLQPLISGITVFEKSRPLYQRNLPLTLSYRENFFTLDFSTLTPAPETPIEYAYRLGGYDDEWVLSPNRSFAPYTGVPGGQYTFAVKARYPNGSWSAPVTLAIRVEPPFWETAWFRTLAGLSLAGLIWGLSRQRERRLLREQGEKSDLRERIATSEMQALRAQMNPHFIYNSLNAIRLFVLQNDSDNAEMYLVKFARLMRLILDNSRQEAVALGSELDQLRLYLELEQLRFNHAFDFSIQSDPALSRQTVLVPPMIIQPFIENAILHGIAHKKTKGHITVALRPVGGHLECSVDDDGVGRQRASELKSKTVTSHQSVGLRVTADRLQLLSQRSGKVARVEVIDKTDEQGQPTGTRVVIELPLVNS